HRRLEILVYTGDVFSRYPVINSCRFLLLQLYFSRNFLIAAEQIFINSLFDRYRQPISPYLDCIQLVENFIFFKEKGACRKYIFFFQISTLICHTEDKLLGGSFRINLLIKIPWIHLAFFSAHNPCMIVFLIVQWPDVKWDTE